MPIYRVHKNKTHPFTIIDNTSINDKRLSAKAKGILLYLISKPDNWYTTLPNLVLAFSDSKYSIRTGLNELIKFGYIIRTHVRKYDGRFTFYDYAVYEQPIKETIGASASPPESENRTLDNRTLENRILLNTDKKKSTEKNNNNTPDKFSSSAAAVFSYDSKNSKTATIKLLKELGIKNLKKIFDLFPLGIIFQYAIWMKRRNSKTNNPTGFLITAIKEKWMDDIDTESQYSESLLFYYKCKNCSKVFGYPDEIPDYYFCNKCRGIK